MVIETFEKTERSRRDATPDSKSSVFWTVNPNQPFSLTDRKSVRVRRRAATSIRLKGAGIVPTEMAVPFEIGWQRKSPVVMRRGQGALDFVY